MWVRLFLTAIVVGSCQSSSLWRYLSPPQAVEVLRETREEKPFAPIQIKFISPPPASISTDGICWRPVDAPQALKGLELLRNRLEGDHRAVFLDIYIVVTAKVVDILSSNGNTGFYDPEWLSELTGRFAEEALIALKSSLECRPIICAPWRLASYLATKKAISPTQDAILGVNAHINYDLPLVLYEFLVSEDRYVEKQALAKYKHDYFLVNRLLKECIPECIDILLEDHHCGFMNFFVNLLPFGRSLVSWYTMQLLIIWRRHVWFESIRLLRAKTGKEREAVVRRLDRRSGRIASLFTLPQLLYRSIRGKPIPALHKQPEAWPGVSKDKPMIRSITTNVQSGKTREGTKMKACEV